jgi:hypothetical protein
MDSVISESVNVSKDGQEKLAPSNQKFVQITVQEMEIAMK